MDAVRLRLAPELTEVGCTFVLQKGTRKARLGDVVSEVHLRYAVVAPLAVAGVPAAGSEAVYLRSHGFDFNIVPPEWLRCGLGRVFSIGPGLVGLEERSLLLAQIFEPEPALEPLLEWVRAYATSVATSDRPEYGVPCLRFSAVIGEQSTSAP